MISGLVPQPIMTFVLPLFFHLKLCSTLILSILLWSIDHFSLWVFTTGGLLFPTSSFTLPHNNRVQASKWVLSSFNHFTGFYFAALLYPVLTLHNSSRSQVNSFFQYTPVVNYGSKVNDTATVDCHIRVDDGVWMDDSAWLDSCGWRDIGSWMNKCGKLSTALLYPVYPFHPESIVAKGRDERGVLINIG